MNDKWRKTILISTIAVCVTVLLSVGASLAFKWYKFERECRYNVVKEILDLTEPFRMVSEYGPQNAAVLNNSFDVIYQHIEKLVNR